MSGAPLIVVHGKSSVGKNTLINHIVANWKWNEKSFCYFHPIGWLKKFLEGVYDCPDLDTREGKEFQAPGANGNMQEIQVAFWKMFVGPNCDQLDPLISTRMLKKSLASTTTQTPLVLTAIRQAPEIDFLRSILETEGRQLIVIKLISSNSEDDEKVEISDTFSDELFEKLVDLTYAYGGGDYTIKNKKDGKSQFFNDVELATSTIRKIMKITI